jgi:hypothetical protein
MINSYKENMSPFISCYMSLLCGLHIEVDFLQLMTITLVLITQTHSKVIKQQNAQIPIHNYQQAVTLIRLYKHTNFIRK